VNDKSYKILEAQHRKNWTGSFGEMADYAIKLEGIEDWIQLTQKPDTPAPVVGSEIFGHTEVQTRNGTSYMKFKKVNPSYTGGGGGQKALGNLIDMPYVISLLEAIAVEVGAEKAIKKKDNLPPEDTDLDEPVNLADIPF